MGSLLCDPEETSFQDFARGESTPSLCKTLVARFRAARSNPLPLSPQDEPKTSPEASPAPGRAVPEPGDASEARWTDARFSDAAGRPTEGFRKNLDGFLKQIRTAREAEEAKALKAVKQVL